MSERRANDDSALQLSQIWEEIFLNYILYITDFFINFIKDISLFLNPITVTINYSLKPSLVAQLVKNLQCRRPGLDPWAGKTPWRREQQPTPVFLPEEFNRSPCCHKSLLLLICCPQNPFHLSFNCQLRNPTV